MNFKECYKAANDEIKGDRELLLKILETPVKEKTKITPMFYKMASLAAALVLIGVIVLMPDGKEKATGTYVPTETTETEEAVYSDVATANAEYDASGELAMPQVKMTKSINDDNVKSYGFSEAIANLGIDEQSLLMENMDLVHDEVYYITHFEDGQTAYEISYRLENGERTMMVILTGSVDPFDLSIEEANGEITASKTIGNTDVFIRANNMTMEEVEEYISSLSLKEE